MFLPRHLARHGSIVDVKWLLAAFAVIAGASFAAGPDRIAAQAQSSPRAVVVAELFTSEGCSSCPPADDLLAELVQAPAGAGRRGAGAVRARGLLGPARLVRPVLVHGVSLRQSDYGERDSHEQHLHTAGWSSTGSFRPSAATRPRSGRRSCRRREYRKPRSRSRPR